jgi:hypothetical protein
MSLLDEAMTDSILAITRGLGSVTRQPGVEMRSRRGYRSIGFRAQSFHAELRDHERAIGVVDRWSSMSD